MSELQKIKDLTPHFYFDIMNNSNIIDEILVQIICVEAVKNWSKNLDFVNYFEKLGLENKIKLAKIILKHNHPDIFKKYSSFFRDIEDVKKWRDDIAHRPIEYQRDSNEQHARLVYHKKEIPDPRKFTERQWRIIQWQRGLTERQMQGIMKKSGKCVKDVREIWTLIGKTKNLRF